nr:unnamed protein product [Digitaria exilis]
MYILQEIPSPQPRTVDLTVRNNLSISGTKDRKYPYPNPGTHPHVGPTSGDHPVSYRSRSRLSPTQQAPVRFFRDTRFRSDDDHFLDLSLILRESHEIGAARTAAAGLTGDLVADDEAPRPRQHLQQDDHNLAQLLPHFSPLDCVPKGALGGAGGGARTPLATWPREAAAKVDDGGWR